MAHYLPNDQAAIATHAKARWQWQFRSHGSSISVSVLLFACLTITIPIGVPSSALAQRNHAPSHDANQLFQQGLQQSQHSQIQAAIASWEEALKLYRKMGDRRGEATIRAHLGNAYFLIGDDAQAITHWQVSLTLAQQQHDRVGEQTALAGLGSIHYFLGNYAEAIAYHKREWAIAQQRQDRTGEVAALRNLGIAYDALGDYRQAVEYHHQGLVIARQIQDRQSESIALRNLGLAYYFLGNYPAAIATYEQALQLARALQDRPGEGWVLGNLGVAYYYLGDYARAIESQQQRLAIAQTLQDRQSEGTALSGLGIAHYYLGDYAQAMGYYQRSLEIARQINDQQSVGAALANLGNVHFSLGEYAQAIEFYQQGLAIARTSQHPQSQSVILGNLGRTFLALSDHYQAIAHHWQALAIARQIKNRQGEGVALGNLGNAYLAAGKPEQAIRYGQQWLAITRQVKDHQGEGAALSDLGAAYQAAGNTPKAMASYQQSLAIARTINSKRGEGLALDRLGYTLFASGKLEAATQTLTAAIQVWESLRRRLDDPTPLPSPTPYQADANKVSLFELQAGTYRLLQQVLVAQHRIDTALEIAERGRARAFVELLSQRLSRPEAEATTPHHPSGSRQFQSTSTAQGKTPPPAPPTPITIDQIKGIAQAQNATLVAYSIIDDPSDRQAISPQESALYIWVIQPTGTIAFRQVELRSPPSPPRVPAQSAPLQVATLTGLVDDTRHTIRGLGLVASNQRERTTAPLQFQPEPDQISRQLKQLYQLLIAPISDLLPTNPNQRVIFIPQGPLFLVPFAALRDERGNYLIEHHTILTAPSIQVLDQTRQLQIRHRQTRPDPALVVGNPVPMPQSLPPLPHAIAEAETVANVLQTQALIGRQATKQAILQRMPTAGWLHFATHGIFDSSRGLGSAIALAPSPTPVLPTSRTNPPPETDHPNQPPLDDGFLTAEQILTMNLNARVVVLSACNTGRGRITEDGVIGLSRSLISAGVPSVVVSLWAVPDAPTAVLMGAFYRHLAHTPDRAQALRQAMLTTMRQFPTPIDWAAFTLIGEADGEIINGQ